MKTRLPLVLAFTAVVGSGVAWAVTPETPAAQPPAEKAHAEHENNHEHEGPRFSAEDRAAFNDARIAALHAGLKLSPDQEKLWPNLETALRNAIKSFGELYKQRQEERAEQKEQPRPRNPVAFLRRLSDIELAHGNAAKAVADAASPLYDTLTQEQKNRLPFLLRGLHRSWIHEHFGMMGGFGGRGPWQRGPEGRSEMKEHNHDHDEHDHDHHHDHDNDDEE
ncbi:Spy/CpxP family protein refolding chaperone [Beijerinckia indica]|uniref:LTXXQ motif family protein n=1 Tax=Beijerinckia indica subsp. indica (strain ATCC 9039 / DSM 1715 / NCIMB 8712) TaxID=395963 RepID=B2ID09_BEII9|nr:Spy/CpxP family protein refolding chaperone [Beijerinckia indica]ACB96774.1 conserved hypothetical protein [Beijerinckia indica subsp. indica ATCC 9039]